MYNRKALDGFVILIMIIFGTLIYFISGCASLGSAAPITSPDTFYRRDMQIKVDGVVYNGVAVLPLKDSYQIEVTTKHDMDHFTATSCHRQIVEDNVGSTGWFSKKSTYKFTYARANEIEKSDPCPLQLVAGADSNEFSWSFIDFESGSLPARLECDGSQEAFNGVSVCQSHKGLTEKITFDVPVYTSFDSNCKMEIPNDRMNFVYDLQRGRCEFVFCSKDRKCHRLTTIGYDEAWVRK